VSYRKRLSMSRMLGMCYLVFSHNWDNCFDNCFFLTFEKKNIEHFFLLTEIFNDRSNPVVRFTGKMNQQNVREFKNLCVK